MPKPRPDASPAGPEITNTLLQLINAQESSPILASFFPSPSSEQMVSLGTPEGILIRLRYDALSISLVEAIKLSRDQEILNRLFQLVEWSNQPEVRAYALVTVASFSDARDAQYFYSALRDSDLGIRFAAVEALQKWEVPGAVDILKKTMQDPWSPLLQIFAAQAVLSKGDPAGLEVLYEFITDRSWILRAMAARYLGDYAQPEDYKKLLPYLERESSNDFVVAELAIAILKLLSQVEEERVTSPLAKNWNKEGDVRYTVDHENVIEIEPLIMVPPRLYIPESVRVSQTINNKLIRILGKKLETPLRPTEKTDPNFENLFELLTPMGFALQTRYSELSLLVIQGLGGTRDSFLQTELRRLAQTGDSERIRASALLALAYSREERNMDLIQLALDSDDAGVRFGAMEAVVAGRYDRLIPEIIDIAYNDPLPPFRVYAAKILIGFGNLVGRDLIVSKLDDEDWIARAMRFWYMGRYGRESDYNTVLRYLAFEKNPFVKSEIALAASRLSPFK